MTIPTVPGPWSRRSLLAAGLRGLALASLPPCLVGNPRSAIATEPSAGIEVEAVVRPEMLFAGIRRPITSRAELEPRIAILETACRGKTVGPLTNIFRFDTPVEGYDSEIGFPVSEPVDGKDIVNHTLREMHFYAADHEGPTETLRETAGALSRRLDLAGLSSELEYVEVYLHRDPSHPERARTRVMKSYLAWPEVYRAQLIRVVGEDATRAIWEGGERVTPFTPVDERCLWVAESIDRLKARTTVDQQFDILSRVALVRPQEDVMQYTRIYEREGDIQAVFRALHEHQSKSPFGPSLDPPTFNGKILHDSKAPYKKDQYLTAKTATERRHAYCFCSLVREASDPRIDPIFCYRAAGWARQLWEPILGVEFKRCTITHSILKGDGFCAWDYHLA